MNRKTIAKAGFVLALCTAASGTAQAGTLFYQGVFAGDDELQLFNINLAVAGAVTVQSYGYAGGVSALGQSVASGGFDSVLTIFDGTGNFVASNNDGACGTVGKDGGTLNCFDSYLSQVLATGAYTIVLSENDNLAAGLNLADSFTQVGNGNFSCPQFLGVSGAFCDATPSQRNGSWALDISTPGTATPEPGSMALLLTGAALLATQYMHVRRRKL